MTHTTIIFSNRAFFKHIAVKEILIQLSFLLSMLCLQLVELILDLYQRCLCLFNHTLVHHHCLLNLDRLHFKPYSHQQKLTRHGQVREKVNAVYVGIKGHEDSQEHWHVATLF